MLLLFCLALFKLVLSALVAKVAALGIGSKSFLSQCLLTKRHSHGITQISPRSITNNQGRRHTFPIKNEYAKPPTNLPRYGKRYYAVARLSCKDTGERPGRIPRFMQRLGAYICVQLLDRKGPCLKRSGDRSGGVAYRMSSVEELEASGCIVPEDLADSCRRRWQRSVAARGEPAKVGPRCSSRAGSLEAEPRNPSQHIWCNLFRARDCGLSKLAVQSSLWFPPRRRIVLVAAFQVEPLISA
ncbi:hypothetical protein EJ03DRAFT_5060 [Teratosphaeria nubilosa]|uniref:Uncharacterized protein n=1 Tax=Teratosphaeria nubilosa TaxID=161662 RepID=A0A6G1LND4_9PEZI|nr:hypothetical protein EJ03DRAFT_5060 [Teratosphaeria nubilosa]